MGKFRNRPGGAGNQKPAVVKGDNRRRVVVLDGKMHGEYSRPVKVTARKLYFGEWTRDNMDTDENNSSNNRGNQERSNNFNGSRPNHNQHARAQHSQHPRPNPNQSTRPNTEARAEAQRIEGRNDSRRDRFNRQKNPNQQVQTPNLAQPAIAPSPSLGSSSGIVPSRPKFEPQKRRFEERRPKPESSVVNTAPINHNRAQKGPLEGSAAPVTTAPRVERPRVRPAIAGAEGAQPATPANLVGNQRNRRRRP